MPVQRRRRRRRSMRACRETASTFSSSTGDAMDLRNHLEGLSRPVLVEVVYLAGRYLTHGLTKESFLRQLDSDVRTKHRDQSVGVVLDLIALIEKAEGSPIRDLSME